MLPPTNGRGSRGEHAKGPGASPGGDELGGAGGCSAGFEASRWDPVLLVGWLVLSLENGLVLALEKGWKEEKDGKGWKRGEDSGRF